MWDSFKSLTSYQALDGGNILPLLDQDNNPVFELEQKCQILQETFFSSNHLSVNNFDENFKKEIETELSDIRAQQQQEQIFDDNQLNDGNHGRIAVPERRESSRSRQDIH